MKLKNINKLDAIIFDFDGVLFDTEPLWFKAAVNTLKKLDFKINKQITYKDTIGVHNDKVFQLLVNEKLNNSSVKKINQVFKKGMDETFNKKLEPFSYLKTFIRKTKPKLLIVSNNNYMLINKLLRRANLKKHFNKRSIISCTKTIKPKPHPDGYKIALNRFNLKKDNILVIEDSETGISSAKNAGIKNILRFTNNNNNLAKKIKHKNIKNIKSYKDLIK